MPKSEQEKFLEDTQAVEKVDVLEAPLEEKPKEEDVEPEEAPKEVKNRRHRRLEEKLQAQREENIQLAERLKNIAEAKSTSAQEDWLKSVEKIYGTESPEATAATELLKGALKAAKDEATRDALAQIRAERAEEAEAVKREEATLDSMVDDLEDEYGVNFTPELEQAFFRQLQKVSPKDEDGNVTEYADHRAVFEEFQSRLKKPENRAKELAARSMTKSGSSPEFKAQSDAELQYLKEQGII